MSPSVDSARLLYSLGLNGAAAVSFRNRLVNGAFTINQRAAPDGPTVYGPGEFVRDRWRAGPAGCTAACKVTANGDATILIGAGSLVQIVEGDLYLPEGGAYCLSWQGTAVGRVLVPGRPAALTAGPVTAVGLTPGSDAAVEYGLPEGGGPVSLRLAQLEPGATPTTFERRDDELRRCQRYYQVGELFAATGGQTYFGGQVSLPVPMRAAGTLAWSDGAGNAERIATDWGGANAAIAVGGPTATATRVRMDAIPVSSPGNWAYFTFSLSADTDDSAFVDGASEPSAPHRQVDF